MEDYLVFYCRVCDRKMFVKKHKLEINKPLNIECEYCNATFGLIFDGSDYALKFAGYAK